MEFPNGSLSLSDNNATVMPPPSLPLGFSVSYYLIFLLIIIPVIFFDVLIILALLVDRTTVGVIRLVLCNIPAACLVVAVTVVVYDVTGLAVAFTDIQRPERIGPLCRAILFLVGAGGAARILFLSAFSATVYYIVRFHKRRNEKSNRHALIGFTIAVIVLWVVAFLSKLPVLFDTIVDSSCEHTVLGGSINVAVFVLVFGIGGFGTSITFLFLTVWYIHQHTVSLSTFKKTMLKLGFFLLVENTISFIGTGLPPIVFTAMSGQEHSAGALIIIYLAAAFIDLSLVPTPILLIIYFKPVRVHLTRWLSCGKKTPTLERGTSEKSTTKYNT